MSDESNRLARVLVSPELLKAVLVDALHFPDGTEIVDFSQDDAGHVSLIVQHKDLRPVAAGDDIPLANPTLRREQTPTNEALGNPPRISFVGWGQE